MQEKLHEKLPSVTVPLSSRPTATMFILSKKNCALKNLSNPGQYIDKLQVLRARFRQVQLSGSRGNCLLRLVVASNEMNYFFQGRSEYRLPSFVLVSVRLQNTC